MKKTLLVLLFFLPLLVWAQNVQLLDQVYEGKSQNKNALQAKREIMDEATEKIVETLIKEIIGETKYGRNKTLIKEKILKNSARFIPFVRPGELLNAADEYRMKVSMKVSISDLQKMLLENGLFYESDATPSIVPLVRWSDKINMSQFVWWKQKDSTFKSFLMKQNKNLEQSLKSAFIKNQFYVMQPTELNYHQIFEHALTSDKLTHESWGILADSLGAQIVLDGEINIRKSSERSEAYVIDIRLSALQILNSRSIADVSRQYETDAGGMEFVVDKKLSEIWDSLTQDLAAQVFEAWSRGAIGSSLYKLVLKGRLPLQQKELFKEYIKNNVREVKNIKERLISSDAVVYVLDSSLAPNEIAQKLKEFSIPPFKVVLDSSDELEIVYKLQRISQ